MTQGFKEWVKAKVDKIEEKDDKFKEWDKSLKRMVTSEENEAGKNLIKDSLAYIYCEDKGVSTKKPHLS